MSQLILTGKRKSKLVTEFHDGQTRAWRAKKRFVLILAGTQSGKTSFGPHWLRREIRDCGPGDYMVVTPTYPLLQLKALPEFRRLFEYKLKLGEYTIAGKKFTFHDGQTNIFFGHAQDPDSLESATAKAVWLDEAGQKKFKLASWEAIQRRLSVHRGRALITTTPYDLGWLKQQLFDPWKAAKGQHPDIDVVSFTSTENPAFPREEYERMQAVLPRWKFDLFYRAIFTRPAGMIYDCFEDDINTCPRFRIPHDWPRFLGLDFGNVNMAGVYFAQEPGSKKLYAYREYKPGSPRPVKEHADALLAGEPMTPTCVGGSGSEEDWRGSFRSFGIPVREPDITGPDSVEVGIDRVYAAIKQRQIVVFKDLTGLLAEIGSYSRVLNDQGQPTEEIDDKSSYHLLDGVRYIVGWLRRLGCGPISPPDEGNRSVIADAPAGVFEGEDYRKELYGDSITLGGFDW